MKYNYIAIEGNIGSGKTSFVELFSKAYNGQAIYEEFEENPFLAKFYTDADKYGFQVELSFLADRFQQLKDQLTQPNLFHDFFIADYFINKCSIFGKINLKPDEYTLFHRMYSIIRDQLPKPELLVYLYKDVEATYVNIMKRARPYEMNISKDYLKSLELAYFNYFKSHQKHYKIVIIDTTELDFVANKNDFSVLAQSVQEEYQLGITRINANAFL